MSELGEENLQDLKKSIEKIYELVETENENRFFLNKANLEVKRLQERIQYYRKLYLSAKRKL